MNQLSDKCVGSGTVNDPRNDEKSRLLDYKTWWTFVFGLLSWCLHGCDIRISLCARSGHGKPRVAAEALLFITEESTFHPVTPLSTRSGRPSLRNTRRREARIMDVGLVEALCDYSRPVFLFGA